MSPRPSYLFAVLILFSAAALPAAELSGVVLDSGGLPLPGATVQLLAAGAPLSQTISDGAGGFRFTDLAPGRYSLRAELDGFSPVEADQVEVGDATTRIELTLQPALQEAVTVEASEQDDMVSAPAGASPGGTIQAQVLQESPLRGDRFQDSLPLLPGVVRGPDGLINIGGARASQSSLLVNGSSVTDPVTGTFATNLPLEAVERVSVFTSPYLAQYGRFTGGVTAVETRPGSNDWKFSFNNFFPRLRTEGGSLRGIDAATPRLRLGGPIVRDRWTFSQSLTYKFVRTDIEELPFGSDESILRSFDSLTQIDFTPNDRDRWTFTASFFPSETEYVNLGALDPQPTVPDLLIGGSNFALARRTILGDDRFLELSYALRDFDLELRPVGELPYRLTTAGRAGNYFRAEDRSGLSHEWLGAYTFPLEARGRHLLKAGFDFSHSDFSGSSRYRPIEVLRRDGSLAQRIHFSGDTAIGDSDLLAGAYLQDNWDLAERLQLELGLRFDSSRLIGDAKLSPRFGFVFNPLQSAKLTLRGGFGRFYDQIFLNIRDFANLQQRTITRFESDGITPIGAPQTFVPTLAQDLDIPSSRTWNLEADWGLHPALLLKINYLERRGQNEFLVEPLATPTGHQVLLSNDGSSLVRELELTARVRARGQEFFVSYVRARSRADLNDFGSLFGTYQQPLIYPNEFGPAPFDVPHRMLFWGSFDLPWGLHASPAIEIRSGFPTTVVSEEGEVVGQRNRGGRFPTVFDANVRIFRDVDLPRGYRARVGFNFFNVTNHFNPRDVQNNLGSAEFGEFFNSVDFTIRGAFQLLF